MHEPSHGSDNVLKLPPRFRRPDNCSVAACSAIAMYEQELERHRRTETSLRASVIREGKLLRQKEDLILQKDTLAKESVHRLLNGLQLINSILSMQSRGATQPETAAQLTSAAKRISTLSRIHQHLHAVDNLQNVEFKQYLDSLCLEISGLLPDEANDRKLCVEGGSLVIPSATAMPLAFIVSELITNSIKYATGKITVSLQRLESGGAILSVVDEGPGLPEAFVPAANSGLGMRIVSALTNQIQGQLSFSKGESGRGTRFSVAFRL